MSQFLLLPVLLLGAWFWLDGMRAKEQATRAARRACERHELQLLDETVVLVGGGLGNAVLFSIGQALRAAGSSVLYFAGYKKAIDRYKVAGIIPITKELERSSSPSAVAVMRQMLVRFIGNLLDKSLLDNLAALAGRGRQHRDTAAVPRNHGPRRLLPALRRLPRSPPPVVRGARDPRVNRAGPGLSG